jgi:hypothetical protein
MSLNDENQLENLCDLDRKGRIFVGGAFGVVVDQLISSSILTSPPLLLL